MKIPYHFAQKHGVLLQELKDNYALIVHHDAIKKHTLLELRRYLQRPLRLTALNREQFQQQLTQHYQSDTASTQSMVAGMADHLDLDELKAQLPKTEDLLESDDEAPVIRLINALFSQAIKQKASDIHLETFEDQLVVRYRIDGILQEVLQVERVLAPLLISRIKIMAKLDIAEKRIPQDGRMSLRMAEHVIDIRVSTLPSNHGERAVLRILDKKNAHLDLQALGMNPKHLRAIEQLLNQPHGIILVTGPTGSGKTTSLYAMLSHLNDRSRNILTIEDPIEYDLPGIGQTQVNNKVDMSFAKGLRAILRQDPDVVMVGEIRDQETADIAVQASLTGHLVLSTLHTNSALGAITRLQDMDIKPFLLSSSLLAVIAQRLVRRLCAECHDSEQGCPACHHSGYQGRVGIYEVIVIDDTLRQMIHKQQSEHDLENYIRQQSISIHQDGLDKVAAGMTSHAEVIRVTHE